jgi:beta-lactamase regulating signal transducer with metallopeptidase domain
MSWLFDTLVWTGALIALVLVARRPVARHLGPKAAYALWVLPLLRLILPPIVLPAWLAPSVDAAATADAAILVLPVDEVATPAAAAAPSFDWLALLVAIWAAGAVVYIVSRLVSYACLRRDLLADAYPVGVHGKVRLLETPATASPLAFGVFDKVVALPPGFMAWTDRRARDLALSHELAHHRAHDLAFNFVALPLFALHWFNPLSLFGWRAMRRDQEAACDARVVEHCDRVERAAYAQLIASAVAGPRGALAAPMACPVLGDKSIVHRLRNLTMTTPSIRRRRAGALLVGASVLLVPLTASISYAQDDSIEAPLPPTPPAPPPAPMAPPEAPLAPVEPVDVIAPGAEDHTYVFHDDGDGAHRERRVVVVRTDKDGKHHGKLARGQRYRVVTADGEFDEKAFEKQMKELHERLGHLDADMAKRVVVIDRERLAPLARESALAGEHARLAIARAPRVVMNCDGAEDVSETTSPDGKRVIKICRQRINGHALSGIRAARDQVARSNEMSESVRKEVLESLDREIARIEAEK